MGAEKLRFHTNDVDLIKQIHHECWTIAAAFVNKFNNRDNK